jgi:dihydroneopterin aldolase
MPGLITIELKRLRFFAHHGLYAGERRTGNEFEVNLLVSYLPSTAMITDVTDTIDYVELVNIVSGKMNTPEDLLETLAMGIAEQVHVRFPQVKHVDIEIVKLYPPIEKFNGQTGVRYSREY